MVAIHREERDLVMGRMLDTTQRSFSLGPETTRGAPSFRALVGFSAPR